MPKLHPKAVYLFWWSYFWMFLFFFLVVGVFLGFVILAVTLSIGAVLSFVITLFPAAFVFSGAWAKLMYESYSYEVSKTALNVKWGCCASILQQYLTSAYRT